MLLTKFQVTPGAISEPLFSTANYNIGYCYFKKKDYSRAAASFRKYLSEKKTDYKMAADANLRLGDCYFMNKDYATAITYYQKAAAANVNDADYALYQAGISYGVRGDNGEQNCHSAQNAYNLQQIKLHR